MLENLKTKKSGSPESPKLPPKFLRLPPTLSRKFIERILHQQKEIPMNKLAVLTTSFAIIKTAPDSCQALRSPNITSIANYEEI